MAVGQQALNIVWLETLRCAAEYSLPRLTRSGKTTGLSGSLIQDASWPQVHQTRFKGPNSKQLVDLRHEMNVEARSSVTLRLASYSIIFEPFDALLVTWWLLTSYEVNTR
jgi:hypothetical protein